MNFLKKPKEIKLFLTKINFQDKRVNFKDLKIT